MPQFEYKAMNQNGEPITGTMEAPVAGAVFEYLDKQNYTPIKISVKKEAGGLNISLFKKKSKIKVDELINFTKQLVTLLKAGVPITSSLEALSEQAENPELKTVLNQVKDDVEGGSNFSDALGKHKTVFDGLYVNGVKAGEAGGVLDQVLERIGSLMAYESEIKQKVKSAIRYPIIVIMGIVFAFAFLMIQVVPTFTDMFAQSDKEMPLPTKVLMAISSVFVDYWYFMITVIIGTSIGLFFYIRTPKGKYNFDKFRIRVPVFGPLALKSAMSRFAHMFETLNKSGLPILQTMEIVSTTIGNVVIAKALEQAGQGIEKGRGISVPLKESELFPPLVIRMIAVGEQSGSLDEMLNNVSEHYDNEVNYLIENLVSMIEPILTVTIGAMVLLLALGIFMPMWSMMDTMG
ncbi:MAG: type II secretion system F family protein [bacterium]|nr:type II secretion system F family protein [bacterium]